jgi:hypothetical protein
MVTAMIPTVITSIVASMISAATPAVPAIVVSGADDTTA